MQRRGPFLVAALWLAVALAACDDEPPPPADADADADLDADGDPDAEDADGDADGDADADEETGFGPTPAFDRFCTDQPWEETTSEAVIGELHGDYLGYYPGFPEGTRFTMKFVPQHPFQVTTLRAAFVGTHGPVRMRLTTSFGRSYPDLTSEGADLIEPVELELEDPDPDTWVEFDVSDQAVFLEPTQHYVLVFEMIEDNVSIAVETLPEGEWSRALILVPGMFEPYGSEGNFRMELAGREFCAWSDEDRWFGSAGEQPFDWSASGRAAFTDLDGDGHADLVIDGDGKPAAFLGDGDGHFEELGFDAFPDLRAPAMMVFGDVDNDGDPDAFAGPYVGWDDDGDGETKLEGDCDDTDAAVGPRRGETMGNGRDDDCDGVADDGTDAADADADGVSIAAGDCDDTRDDVSAGAVELLDGRDNDCDGETDEDFVDRILRNDGTGLFSAVEAAGVERLDQSTAAGWGDGDGDGNLDIYWGNWLVHYPDDPAVQDCYFTGRGDGTFVDALEDAGMWLEEPYSVYGVIWNDYNNDGLQDVYVGNYHMYPNLLWQNQGDGTFVDVALDVGVAYDDIPGPDPGYLGGHSYGGDFGDVDNDGDLDFYLANLAHPRVQPWSDTSQFLINQGPPDYTFVNAREAMGFIYDEGDMGAAFADYDHDMDLDVAVASIYPVHFSRLYRNDGDRFTDVSYETGTAVHITGQVIWTDVDEDGDLDLIEADGNGAPGINVFLNRVGQDRGWVELLLEGATTNRDAIGARATLEAGGVTQLRDVRGGGGNGNPQADRMLHFGLADVEAIDDLTVRWVGGETETFEGVEPRGRYRLVEGAGRAEPLD